MSVRNTTASRARAATTRVQSLLESSVQAARQVTRFLGTMAAAGMGADSTPPASPTPFPFDDKDDRVDDGDEYEEDVDNSFDYIPATNELSDSGEDAWMVRSVESIKQVVMGIQEDVTMENVAGVLTEERHSVFQETTVFRKVSHPDSDEEQKGEVSDTEQQHKELMAFALRPLADEPVTTLALKTPAAEVFSNFMPTNGSRDVGGEKDGMSEHLDKANAVVDGNAEAVDFLEEQTFSTTAVPGDEQLVTAKAAMDMTPDDEVVSETPPSVDTVQEADDGKNDTSDGRQGDQQQLEPVPPPPDSAPPIAINTTAKSPESCEAEMQTANARKRTLEVSSPGVNQDNGQDDGLKSPVKTEAKPPGQTPKHSKQAASKKRKKSPHPLHSGSKDSPPVRRSSRQKHETPRFTSSVQHIPDETAMAHFDRNTAAGALSPVMTCHFCRKEMTASRAMALRHLNTCPAYLKHEKAVPTLDLASEDKADRLPDSVPAVKSEVMTEEIASASVELTLVKLMGSQALAAKLKQSIGSPFAADAPLDRFRELIEDDDVGLRHLQVDKLLDVVDPIDEPAVLLHPLVRGGQRSTWQDAVSVSTAKARNLEKCPLRFSAPRKVGEQFIFLLAGALGLGYALQKHRAKLVSCPQDGTLLDWQFHKTETVAFQLRGKVTWQVKKSQMEHPVQSFHPQSWSFDDVASVAKTHRIASMDKRTVGFLAPPGEDVDTFDGSLSGDVVAGQEEGFSVKPGSVVYVPAGAWFETETHGANALWLEVQLASTSCEELVFSALRQLAWGNEQWRMPVRIYPGDRAQTKQMQRHVDARIKSLGVELGALESSDLLPEYLVTNDLQELVAEGLVRDRSASPDAKSLEVDLTDPRLKLEHSKKVFLAAVYRVNPVAVLMSADEIPHLSAHDEPHAVEVAQASSSTMKPPRALKKTPKPKLKQKPKLRAISNTTKHTYVLDEAFGNDKFQSQLHVKFQCSGEQSRMVEWLRSRGTEPFDLKEVIKGQSTQQLKIPEKKARALLRFLHFVGYVSQVKSP